MRQIIRNSDSDLFTMGCLDMTPMRADSRQQTPPNCLGPIGPRQFGFAHHSDQAKVQRDESGTVGHVAGGSPLRAQGAERRCDFSKAAVIAAFLVKRSATATVLTKASDDGGLREVPPARCDSSMA